MPVRSKAQWGWLGAHRPDLLRKWQAEAPVNYRRLPRKVRKRKKR